MIDKKIRDENRGQMPLKYCNGSIWRSLAAFVRFHILQKKNRHAKHDGYLKRFRC